jgi:hypothetical protein
MSTHTKSMIEKSAKNFNLSSDDFLKESTRIFLEKKLKEVRSNIFEIASKYGISSISDFEELYKKGKLDEFDSFEDYKTLDRLEFQKEKIEKLLSDMNL